MVTAISARFLRFKLTYLGLPRRAGSMASIRSTPSSASRGHSGACRTDQCCLAKDAEAPSLNEALKAGALSECQICRN